VNIMRKAIGIPAVTLKLLIGEGSINPGAFRRNTIERFWPCGCLANYRFGLSNEVQWTPCQMHGPTLWHLECNIE
jgi:hypothetical protein